MVLRVLLSAWVLCATAAAGAQETPGPEAVPTPDLSAVRLLDEVPNYAEVLAHQWQSGVPTDAGEAARRDAYYGRLIETGSATSITLQESIALALENNTGLQVERLTPLSATAGVRAARSIFDPAFFAGAGKSRVASPFSSVGVFTSGDAPGAQPTVGPTPATGVPPKQISNIVDWSAGVRKTLLTGGELAVEWTNNRQTGNPNVINLLIPRYETTLGLSLNQPLLRNFGWRYALLRVEVAQTVEEQTYYQYRANLANLVSQVETTYWVLVLANENVRVQERGVELARELLRQNEGRFNVGALPRTAVLEAQAVVASRESQLVAARNAQQNARDNLRAIINYRPAGDQSLLLVEPADLPTVVPYDIDLERSLETARTERPELIAARLNIDSKKLERKIAENQLLPRLDFGGSVGLNGLGGTATPSSSSTFSTANPQVTGGYDRSLELLTDGRFYQYTAGIQLEVPIANAQAKADYAQANIDTERSWLSLHQLEENVTLEIKRAVSNLQSDLKGIESTRVARELAEENLRNQQARYDVGLATTKDLLDYQDRLTQARREEIFALTKYNSDLAEMRRVDGTLLRARNIEVERREPESPSWWARF